MMKKPSPMKSYEMGEGFFVRKNAIAFVRFDDF